MTLLVLAFIQPIQPISPLNSAYAATTGSTNCLTTVSSNSGITVTDYTSTTGYCLLKFTTAATITMTASSRISEITVLAVGGGGGGGFNAGEGGGGGAIIYGTASAVGVQTFDITVGAGGNGGANSSGNYSGNSGNQSAVVSNDGSINIVAGGGGGGATHFIAGCTSTGTDSESSNFGGEVLSSTGLNVITTTTGAKGALFAASGVTPSPGIAGTAIAFPTTVIYGSSGGAGRLTGSPGGSSGGNGAGAGGAHNANGTTAGASLGAGGGGGGSNCKNGGNGGSGIVYLSYKVANRDSTGVCKLSAFSTLDLSSNTNLEIRKVENDCVAIFKGTGSYTLFRGEASIYEYLIVAGGGSGGRFVGGGGGGGGVLTGNYINSSTATLNITVGAGGAAKTGNGTGNSGASSSALGFTAIGGGAGAAWQGGSGSSGGSGGGAGGFSSSNAGGGGAGRAGQGNDGGDTVKGRPTDFTGGAGGGGAGSVGGNSSNVIDAGGDGGDGVASEILGSTYYFGGGGGGGSYCNPSLTECLSGKRPGNGGIGGGGGGSAWTSSQQSYGFGGGSAINSGSDAEAASSSAKGGSGGTNTGGGGGGSGQQANSGAGGSGIVILRWASQPAELSFAINDANSGSAPANLSYWPGSANAITIPGNPGNLAKTGKFFAGWNTNSDASGNYFLPGDQFLSIEPSQTLYAIFRYKVSFSLNDGSGQAPNPIIPPNGVATLPSMPESTKDDNPFLGWCDVAVGSVNCFGSGRTFTPTGNTTLYALFGPSVSINHIDTQTVTERLWSNSESLTATGGFGTKTFSVSSPTTTGLSLAPSATPSQTAIRVSPTVFAETYTAIITATDQLGNRGYETTTILVQKPGKLAPVSQNLQATVGTGKTFGIPVLGGIGNLSATITVTGPGDTTTITLGDPLIVDGFLNLNVSNQTMPGRYQIVIQLIDDSALVNRTAFTLDVKPEISLSYQAVPGAISQDSLTVHWQVSQSDSYLSTGTYLNDLAGNSNATIRGPSNSPSPLLFSGQDPLYIVGDSSYLQLSVNGFISSNQPLISDTATSYSLLTWVYPQGNGSLISLCATNTCDTSARTSIAELSSNGALSLRSPQSVLAETETALTLNEWHYLGYTIDSATSTMSIFVDGQHLGDESIENGAGSSRSYVALGASATDSMTANNGGLGQFRFGALHFYSRALDTQTVLNNFDATKDGYINVVSQQVNLTMTQGVTKAFGPFKASLGSGTKTFALSDTQSGKLSLISLDSATVTLRVASTLSAIDSVTAATYYDTITVTDGAGASSLIPLKIMVNPPLQIIASSETMTAISGSTESIELVVSGGTGSTTLGLIGSGTTTAFTLTTTEDSRRFLTYDGSSLTGSYLETITVTDISGAVASVLVTVTAIGGITVSVSPARNISITTSETKTITLDPIGGMAPYSFQRTAYAGQDSATISFDSSTGTLIVNTGLSAGTTTLESIIVSDSLGESATVLISIRVGSQPIISGPDSLQFTYGNIPSSVETLTVVSDFDLAAITSQTAELVSGLRMKFFEDPLPYPIYYATAGVAAPSTEPCYTMYSPTNVSLANLVSPALDNLTQALLSCSSLNSSNNTTSRGLVGFAEGYFISPITGSIAFVLAADDRATLEFTTDVRNTCSVLTYGATTCAPVSFTAGAYYPIRIWYSAGGGGDGLNLKYQWSGQSAILVPASAFASANRVLNLALSNSAGTSNIAATLNTYSQFDSTTIQSRWETITVTDIFGQSGEKLVNIVINPSIAVSATADSLTVIAGIGQFETLTALYGTGVKTFSVNGILKEPNGSASGTGLDIYVRNCTGLANTKCDVKSEAIIYEGVDHTSGNIAISSFSGSYRGSNNDYFTIYAEGFYESPVTGSVTFSFNNDDSLYFELGSGANFQTGYAACCSIANPGNQFTITNLVAGQLYPFKIWLNEVGGNTYFLMYHAWSNQGGSSQVRTLVPTSNFHPPSSSYSTQSITIKQLDNENALLLVGPGVQSGNYFATVTVTDQVGAQASVTIEIGVTAPDTNNPKWSGTTGYSLMNGATLISDTYTVIGGTAPYGFEIFGDSSFAITSRIETPTGAISIESTAPLTTGSYSFSLRVTDANLRSDSITVVVGVSEPETASNTQIVHIPYGTAFSKTFNLPSQSDSNPRIVVYPQHAGWEVDTSTVSTSSINVTTQSNLPSGGYTFAAQYRTESVESDTVSNLKTILGSNSHVQGVVTDSLGNFYIADYTGDRILKYTSSGEVSTYAGTGSTGNSDFSLSRLDINIHQPMHLAIDNNGCLIIGAGRNGQSGQYGTSLVMRINLDGSVTKISGIYGAPGNTGDGGLAINANVGETYGIAVDPQGNIYISASNAIRVISADTGIITTLEIPATSNSVNINITGTAMKGIAIDPAGILYIADNGKHRILKYVIADEYWTVAAGSVSGSSGSTTNVDASSALLNKPYGIAVDGFGDIWIAEDGGNKVRVIGRDDNVIRDIAGMVGILRAVAVAPSGDVMALEWSGGAVKFLDRKISNTLVRIVVDKAPAQISMDIAAGVDITRLQYGVEYPLVLDIEPIAGSLNLQQVFGGSFFDSLDCNDVEITLSKRTCQWVPISAGNVTLKASFIPASSRNYSTGSLLKTFVVAPADTFTVTFNSVANRLGEDTPSLFTVRGITAQDSVTAIVIRYIGQSPSTYDSTTAPFSPGTYTLQVDDEAATPIVFGTNSQGALGSLANYKGFSSNIGQIILSKGIRPPLPRYSTVFVSSTQTFTPTVAALLSRFSLAYSSPSASVCSVNSSTGVITAIATGYCDITLSISDANWNDYFILASTTFSIAITKAVRSLVISDLTATSLKYGQSATATINISHAPTDGTITYTLAAGSACSVITTANLQITIKAIKGSGICTIIANISEGLDYISASSNVLTITISKADAPIFSISRLLSAEYSGATPANPAITAVQGLVNGDQVTAYSFTYTGNKTTGTSYSASAATADGGSYLATLSSVTLTGSVNVTTNYNTPTYPTSQFRVFPVEQPSFSILSDVGFVGIPTTLSYSSSRRSSATETIEIVDPGTTGCTAGSGVITASSVGSCSIRVTRPADNNYLTRQSSIKVLAIRQLEQTVVTQQVAPSAQETVTIGIQGGTGLEIGSTACTSGCVPTITSISPASLAALSLLTITGTNFNTATEVIFNRRYRTTTLQINSDTEIVVQIPAEVPIGAGSLSVVASGGTSFRFSGLTIIP